MVDTEDESEDCAGQIYELDQHNLELGQLIGQVIILFMILKFLSLICLDNWTNCSFIHNHSSPTQRWVTAIFSSFFKYNLTRVLITPL